VILVLILSMALPAPYLPVRTERTFYAGPDLLSDVEPTTRLLDRETLVPGLVRRSKERVTQARTLLREEEAVEVKLPVPLLIVALVWGGLRLVTRRRQLTIPATPATSRSTSSSEV